MNRDSHIVEIELDKIVPNRFQPRKVFNEDVSELAESIRQHGVLQPITVRPLGEKFEIIMGERRFRACEKLGLKKIPAMIVEMNDRESMEVALIENLQRQNLTPIEEALSYKRILDAGYVTQEQLAVKLGKTQSTIANKLRLLALDKDVQNALLKGDISERHARSLLRLENKEAQRKMLSRIISERLTVKRTDEEIRKMERNNLDEFKPSIEIIDFDDNPFKAYESPKSAPKEEPVPFKNIPITQIIDDTEDEGNSALLEVNHSYNNNFVEEKYQNKEISFDKTQQLNVNPIEQVEPFEEVTKQTFEPTFDEMIANQMPGKNSFDEVRRVIERCQSDIQALGYKVEFENFDFETMYQIILKIRKLNSLMSFFCLFRHLY